MISFRSAVLLLTTFLGLYASPQADTSADSERRTKAIAFVRIVNTAEAQHLSMTGHYGSLDDIRSSGSLNKAEAMFSTKFDMADPTHDLPGLVVRIVASREKKSYQISITKDAKPFTVGFFSDERGLIYEGHPLQ
jgi:hypothetical protein